MNRLLLVCLPAVFAASSAVAAEYTLTLKDHKFSPETLEVPAGEKHTLIVKNEDKTAAEFESNSLNREKIIKGGGEAKVLVGPLKPGSYEFFDEFHESTAKGVLVVK